MTGDPVGDLVRLDTARQTEWRRVRDVIQRRRDQLVGDLVRGTPNDFSSYAGVVGEIRGVDFILKALDKEFSNGR
jgi:hypothetical protein